MEARSVEFIRTAISGQLIGSGAAMVTGISTDSRTVRAGDCFVALAGEKFDGHDFVGEVAAKGVSAVVVNADRAPAAGLKCALLAVADTRRALGQLAARYRGDFKLPVVAVAGSNGKTTTKEILAAVLRQKFSTLWSEASFNNDIGVPLTLLKLEEHHAAAVFELGTNHPGELAPLIRMVRPEIGVITSIGREHLEFFGSIAGVAEEEGWMAELLPAFGMLVINGDSEWTATIAKRCKAEVVRVGRSEANDWRVRKVNLRESGISFQVDAPEQRFSGEYSLPLFGAHQAINATLAMAVATKVGLNPEDIRKGFADAKPAKMRLEMREINGVRMLDDSYNANADSMMVALQTLRDLPAEGRRVAVLGDMAELGEHTEAAHQEVGAKAAELGLAQLFTVGKWATQTAEAARSNGLAHVCVCPDAEAAIVELKKFLRPGDLLLLKASRVAGLERVSAALQTDQ